MVSFYPPPFRKLDAATSDPNSDANDQINFDRKKKGMTSR